MNILDTSCKRQDCTGNPPDTQGYSLQDALVFNGTPITVVVTCPEGAVCTPGTYPPTVTFPPGEFVFPETPPPLPGQPIVLGMQGCQSFVSRTLPAGSSAAVILQAQNDIIAEVAAQQAQCDVFPQFPFGTVASIGPLDNTYACLGLSYSGVITAGSDPESYPLIFTITSGTLPPGITLSSTNANQAIFSGTATTAGTYNFTLRAITQNGVQATRNFTITVVGITTTSPLPPAPPNEIYSTTLAATMSGTLLWGIASGALPDGLAINSTTGEITGIPTTEGSSSFTVFVQNSTQQCSKTFVISVESGSACELFDSISWGSFSSTGFTCPASGSAAGNSFTLDASCTVTFFEYAFGSISGTVNYTGDEIECNLELDVTTLSGGSAGVICTITSDIAGLIFTATVNTSDTVGVYNFPITIPASVGAVLTIYCEVHAGASENPGSTGSIIAVGTFGPA